MGLFRYLKNHFILKNTHFNFQISLDKPQHYGFVKQIWLPYMYFQFLKILLFKCFLQHFSFRFWFHLCLFIAELLAFSVSRFFCYLSHLNLVYFVFILVFFAHSSFFRFVFQAAQKYLPRFLDSKQTQTAVVCSPPEVENIKYIFSHFGLDLKEINDLENSILTN